MLQFSWHLLHCRFVSRNSPEVAQKSLAHTELSSFCKSSRQIGEPHPLTLDLSQRKSPSYWKAEFAKERDYMARAMENKPFRVMAFIILGCAAANYRLLFYFKTRFLKFYILLLFYIICNSLYRFCLNKVVPLACPSGATS